MKDKILQAARADAIPAGESGLWTVKKFSCSKPIQIHKKSYKDSESDLLPPGRYTSLFRLTLPTMMNGGELVMHDFPAELNTHLQFMLMAYGRVLVTGLGLGCVARGLLANPMVKHVVVIEESTDVLKLVGQHMPKERLTIVHANALTWVKKEQREPFDCAWHDLWEDESEGGEHLQVQHVQMICDLAEKVKFQGAWALPRDQRRAFRRIANVI